MSISTLEPRDQTALKKLIDEMVRKEPYTRSEMLGKLCCVCLGRAGDVISVLPCIQDLSKSEGAKCDVMVCQEFADILDGVSYAKPIIFKGHFTETDNAIAYARELGYERILCGRANEKAINPNLESFTEQQWDQLGCLHLYKSAPLIFDRRDFTREAALMQKHRISKPFGLYNFGGKSSPVPDGEQWLSRNVYKLGVRDWYDLQRIKAERIYDLLGLFDQAELLVTGDTATCHLAAASKVPTLNFIQDKPLKWFGSKPRNNSIMEMRYSEMKDLESAI